MIRRLCSPVLIGIFILAANLPACHPTADCSARERKEGLGKIRMLRAVSYNVRRFKAVGSGESTVNVSCGRVKVKQFQY